MNSSNIKTVVIVLVLVIAGAAWAYWYFGSGSNASLDKVTVTSGSEDGTISTNDIGKTPIDQDPFVDILNGIGDVTLENKTLLSNPIFKDKLQSMSRQVEDRGKGRSNPFAPIGVGNISKTVGGVQTASIQFNGATTTKAKTTTAEKTKVSTSTDTGNDDSNDMLLNLLAS